VNSLACMAYIVYVRRPFANCSTKRRFEALVRRALIINP
jgi:hypothetical protein